MKTDPRDTTAALISAFYAAVRQRFAFLLGDPAATLDFRTREFRPGGIVDSEPEAVRYFFLASGSFRNGQVHGVIEFGDREYTVNTLVAPMGNHQRFALWEWARALNADVGDLTNSDFVMTVDRVESIVATMASALAQLLPDIASADAILIDRIEQARAERQREFLSPQREDNHRRARAGADDAFREGNYRRVVELLGPFEDLLTRAELRKLALTRRRLGES